MIMFFPSFQRMEEHKFLDIAPHILVHSLRWKLREKLGLSLGIRYMLPLFNIWTDNGLSFFDHMMVSATIGVQFYFSDKNEEDE